MCSPRAGPTKLPVKSSSCSEVLHNSASARQNDPSTFMLLPTNALGYLYKESTGYLLLRFKLVNDEFMRSAAAINFVPKGEIC